MANYVITIARGFGSGGKTIGKMLSEQLGIHYYDREILKMASEESGIHERFFGKADEKGKSALFKSGTYSGELLPPQSGGFVSDDNLFNYQAKIIKDLADKESCVIVGRCADFILNGRKNVLRTFIYAPRGACIETVMDLYGLSCKDADKLIDKTDRERSSYYKYYTGRDWKDATNYDLCLNSSALNFEKCAEIMRTYLTVKGFAE